MRLIGPAEWRFETNGFGKPEVVAEQAGEPPLAFSLSHQGLVACAIMRGASVGIDVERCGRGVADSEIESRYFAESEIRHLQTSPPEQVPDAIHRVLGAERVLYQGSRVGPLPRPALLFIRVSGDSNLRFTPHDSGSGWQFWLMALPDSRLALVRPRARARASPRCALRLAFHDAGVANEIRHLTLVRWSDSFDAAAR